MDKFSTETLFAAKVANAVQALTKPNSVNANKRAQAYFDVIAPSPLAAIKRIIEETSRRVGDVSTSAGVSHG